MIDEGIYYLLNSITFFTNMSSLAMDCGLIKYYYYYIMII